MTDKDCAHQIVRRHAVGVPDPEDLTKSIVKEWWSCDECQQHFLPVATIATTEIAPASLLPVKPKEGSNDS